MQSTFPARIHWGTGEGVIRQADALGMGIVLLRPLTSGVFSA